MKDFKKSYLVPAPPEMVYAALTVPATLELWTGEPADMSAEPGSEFSLWDGSINGRNIAFEPGKKIVQEWYFGGEDAPSIVTITLEAEGPNTRAEVVHTNIPDEEFDSISAGWTKYYFRPLIEFYG